MFPDLIDPFFLVINIFLAIGLVFFERKNPTAALGWILILFAIPIIGFILYLLFGQNFYKRKLFRMKAQDDQYLHQLIGEQKRELTSRELILPDRALEPYRGMMEMFLENSMSYLSRSNRVDLYTDGHDKFDALFAAIRGARDHVHLEYYIIRDDRLGNELLSLLKEKAREGVEVRLLYDAVGTRFNKRKVRDLQHAGVRVAVFFPSLIGPLNFRINYRNHRKIAVIDGKTGFIGGFNIGVEYLSEGPLGYWRDTAIRIHGDGVWSLQVRFFLDWSYATKESPHLAHRYFPELEGGNATPMQVVSSGPDARWNQIKEGYLKMINSARKNVFIQTPYFIPDESVSDALRIAALSGVDVRIIFPTKPDHPFVYWSSYSYIGDLLEAGVRAYTYEKGFIHSKTIVVDGLVSSVGSANWDVRSFRLNFEANAFVYDPELARGMETAFMEDLPGCKELTLAAYRNRSLRVKFKESISRLFSPLL
jgi:cardiolipin synthase